MWVIHSWPWYWLVWPWWGGRMYRIVTGVTSDVGVPSTYLVFFRKRSWSVDHSSLDSAQDIPSHCPNYICVLFPTENDSTCLGDLHRQWLYMSWRFTESSAENTKWLSLVVAVTYPLDLTKTRLQTQGELLHISQNGQYRGMFRTAAGIGKALIEDAVWPYSLCF